jgi:hypothetical protein
MNLRLRTLLLAVTTLLAAPFSTFAQCTRFETVTYDGFEYTTICPDIVPGMVIHNTPQTFGVRTGTYALYLNMIDCIGGVGTCAGDSVYIRTVACCPNQPIRFRWWMKTVFTGTLSDIRVVLTDGNDNILADVPSTVAPFGSWLQFTSPAVIPGTFVVKLKIYTNINGQNGNDLGIDDMYIERCANSSLSAVTACSNATSLDLFASIPGTPVTTGTWAGPTVLGNTYQGTYSVGSNTPGYYIYTSTPYGIGGLCLAVNDSVNVTSGITPQPNLGNDTTACVNQAFQLNPGISGPGLTYLWSTFATTATVNAFSGSATQTTYSVTVSSTNGCVGRDSIRLTFQVCSGLNETDRSDEVSIYPNPAQNVVTVQLPGDIQHPCLLTILSIDGKEVLRQEIDNYGQVQLPELTNGVYLYSITDNQQFSARGKITVRN